MIVFEINNEKIECYDNKIGFVEIPLSTEGLFRKGEWGEYELQEIKDCRKWISDFTIRRKTPNTRISSYGLKHIVEANEKYNPGRYISNGSFIRAALEMGYYGYMSRNDYYNKYPNCFFNMSFGIVTDGRLLK